MIKTILLDKPSIEDAVALTLVALQHALNNRLKDCNVHVKQNRIAENACLFYFMMHNPRKDEITCKDRADHYGFEIGTVFYHYEYKGLFNYPDAAKMLNVFRNKCKMLNV